MLDILVKMRLLNWIRNLFKREDTELDKQIRAIPQERLARMIREIKIQNGL